MKKIFLQGLKLGLIFNVSIIVFALVYISVVEQQLAKPLDKFSLPLKLGTVVTSDRIYFKDSLKKRDSWLRISNKFNFFVVEYELNPKIPSKSSRFLDWCITQTCFAHRIDYSDVRAKQFNYFTIDDWWTNNKFSVYKDTTLDELKLKNFFKTLPDGSLVVISEPFSIFKYPDILTGFFKWVLALRSAHPNLKFELGLQIHLQWIDFYWLRYSSFFPEFEKFSKTYNYPWGVSEYSNYDRIWKDLISLRWGRWTSLSSLIERAFHHIEGLIFYRFRRAIVLHATYQIHKDAVRYGAVRFVEWGNFQHTAWFFNEVDPSYDSNYLLFDASGQPTDLWWAAMRGLKDGK